MTINIKTIFTVAGIVTLALLLLAASLLDRQPTVEAIDTLLFEDVGRIKEILRANNPNKLKSGEQRDIFINQRDLNLILNYAAKRVSDLRLHATPRQELVQLQGSLAMPLFGFLNFEGELELQDAEPHFRSLRLGWWSLPDSLMPVLSERLHQYLGLEIPSYQRLWQALQQLEITPEHVHIRYLWNPHLLQDLKSHGNWLFFDESERERMLVYQKALADLSRKFPGRWAPLHQLLQPLFKLAQSRSLGGEDAVAENRALLQALSLYVLDNKVKHLLPDVLRQELPTRRVSLLLERRQDLAQHFVLSAAVAVSAGSGLADAVGLFKEVHDSQEGSGFSFADLLADRAGIRLAELATESRRSARHVQDILTKSRSEHDYMPKITDLPEGIMELEFKSRYEDLDSETYQLVETEIQQRIATCKLHSSI